MDTQKHNSGTDTDEAAGAADEMRKEDDGPGATTEGGRQGQDSQPVSVIVVVRRQWLAGVASRAWQSFRRRGIWLLLGCFVLAGLVAGLERRSPAFGALRVKAPLTSTCCVLLSRTHPLAGVVYGAFGGLFVDALSPGLPLGLSCLSLFLCVYLFGGRGWTGDVRIARAEPAFSCGLGAMVFVGFGIVGATFAGTLTMPVAESACRLVFAGLAGAFLGASATAAGAGCDRLRRQIRSRRQADEK